MGDVIVKFMLPKKTCTAVAPNLNKPTILNVVLYESGKDPGVWWTDITASVFSDNSTTFEFYKVEFTGSFPGGTLIYEDLNAADNIEDINANPWVLWPDSIPTGNVTQIRIAYKGVGIPYGTWSDPYPLGGGE